MSSVIVVEGIHDEMRIKNIFKDAVVVTTNGREIPPTTLAFIKKLSLNNEIIVFTDPDSPGEKIRMIITELVPTAKHAFLRKKDCISKNKKKVGIEHAPKECIIEALENVITPNTRTPLITTLDLYELKLNGFNDSANIRNKISEELNIGRPNAKTFLKRVNLLGLTKEGLSEMICKIK